MGGRGSEWMRGWVDKGMGLWEGWMMGCYGMGG